MFWLNLHAPIPCFDGFTCYRGKQCRWLWGWWWQSYNDDLMTIIMDIMDLLESIYIMWKTNLTIYCTVFSRQKFSSFTFCGISKWMLSNSIPFSIAWLKYSILNHNPLKVVQWCRLDILVVFCHREIDFCIHSCFFQTLDELLEYDQYSKIKAVIIPELL